MASRASASEDTPGRTRACQPDANPGRADRLDAGRFEHVASATGSCARLAATGSESRPRSTTLLPNGAGAAGVVVGGPPDGRFTTGMGRETGGGWKRPVTGPLGRLLVARLRLETARPAAQPADPRQGGPGESFAA